MRRLLALFASLAWALSATAAPPDDSWQPRRILFIGDPQKQRAQVFAEFLRKHFEHVDVAARDGFNPLSARTADVVVLDWPQTELAIDSPGETRPALVCPLGSREHWSRPTVLLGSAGLVLSTQWKTKGGWG